MSAESNSNRWVPFQCPSCFGLFRLRKPQIGSVGHCPTCDQLVHVSNKPTLLKDCVPSLKGKGAESLPREKETDDLLDKVSVAQQMTPEEVAKQEEFYSNQKRQYSAGGSDIVDWEKELEGEERLRFSWLTIWLCSVLFVLGLAGAAYYVKNKNLGPGAGGKAVIGDDASLEKLDEILDKGSKRNGEGRDEKLEQVVDQAGRFDLTESEAVLRGFLESSSVSERLKYVRDPERVHPLMLKYYDGEGIEPEGFSSYDKAKVEYQEGFFTTVAQTADFLDFPIALEDIGGDQKNQYLVDWESWVGYGDMKPQAMRSQKPTTPQLMRAVITVDSYYNYHFSNDREWSCFRLEMRDSEYTFLGYAKRGGALAKKMLERMRAIDTEKLPFTIKVAYPANSRSEDQVEIVEILSAGWIINLEEENNNE